MLLLLILIYFFRFFNQKTMDGTGFTEKNPNFKKCSQTPGCVCCPVPRQPLRSPRARFAYSTTPPGRKKWVGWHGKQNRDHLRSKDGLRWTVCYTVSRILPGIEKWDHEEQEG